MLGIKAAENKIEAAMLIRVSENGGYIAYTGASRMRIFIAVTWLRRYAHLLHQISSNLESSREWALYCSPRWVSHVPRCETTIDMIFSCNRA